jgi:hypothetical protein
LSGASLRYALRESKREPLPLEEASMQSKGELELGDDLLVGVTQIAEHLKQPRRRVQYWVDHHLIPVSKTGTLWTALKSELRQHFAGGKVDAA